jgi:hypothetical protein
MASKLKTLLQQKTGSELQKSYKDSVEWLKNKIKNINRSPVSKFKIGGLYFFYYEAKGADKLPYYDRFPLVIPLERYTDGFLGLNLHYLPLSYRVAFLDKLMDYADQGEQGEIMSMRISYDILSASKRLKEFKPCVKRYLTNQVQSKLVAVEPEQWQNAILLPVHKFTGASPSYVWQESIEQI